MRDHLAPLASPKQRGKCPRCSSSALSISSVGNLFVSQISTPGFWFRPWIAGYFLGQKWLLWTEAILFLSNKFNKRNWNYYINKLLETFLLAKCFFHILCSYQHETLFWLNKSAEIGLLIYFSRSIRNRACGRMDLQVEGGGHCTPLLEGSFSNCILDFEIVHTLRP